MAYKSTAGGEDALGDHHAVHVFRARLITNQDDLFTLLRCSLSIISSEICPANSRTRRCTKTLCDRSALLFELRVKHRIEMLSRYSHHGFFTGNLPLTATGTCGAFRHVDCHLQRSCTSAFTDSCLQHPQTSLLDSELGVAHVGVVLFKSNENLEQLGVN